MTDVSGLRVLRLQPFFNLSSALGALYYENRR